MYKAPFELAAYAKLFITTFLTSLGAVGLGSWINSLSFLLDSFMLPQDSINLFLTSLPFTSGFQSMVSISQIGMIAFLVTLLGAKAIKLKFLKIIKGIAFSFIPIIALFQLIRIYNPLPPIESRSKSIYDLSIASNVPVSISDEGMPVNHESTLARIKQSKVLRVGFAPRQAPLSFKNSYGELVGFDIAFAHQLAYDLGCELELVPLDYANIVNQVNQGIFDIGMSAISMNESRIKSAYFSQPYLTSPIIFVMKENVKKQLKTSANIIRDSELKIAAVKGTSYAELLPKLFPEHKHILLDSYNAFDRSSNADVLIWNEYEAIAWILKHRTYRIMFPTPAIGQDTLCYIMKQGDREFLEYVNNWLVLKKDEGFFQHQYNLWIQGKTDSIEVKDRRWSVIRNVFNWGE